ncbi:unnamed protein product, partial [marine sediment metagenome]
QLQTWTKLFVGCGAYALNESSAVFSYYLLKQKQ